MITDWKCDRIWECADPKVDMVEGPDGRWWAVFLAVRPQNGVNSQLGRETFLLPIEWVDDWPIVNQRQPASIQGPTDVYLPRSGEYEEWSDQFSPNTSKSPQCLSSQDADV